MKSLNKQIEDIKIKFNNELDVWVQKNDDLKVKCQSDISKLKKDKSELGDKYCMKTLELSQARVEELKIELDICNSGTKKTGFTDLKSLFDREKKKFESILTQNQKEKDHKYDKYAVKKKTISKGI